MAYGLVRGVDLSRFSLNGPLQPYHIECFRKHKIEVVVVGIHHGLMLNDFAQDSIRVCRVMNMPVAGYIALTPSMQTEEIVERSITALGDEIRTVKFVAIDVELDGITAKDITLAEDMLREYGLRPVLYTSGYYWRKLGLVGFFEHLPLWYAKWDYNEKILRSDWVSWWKGKIILGKQYKNDENLCGVLVDMNVFNSYVLFDEYREIKQKIFVHLDSLWGKAEILERAYPNISAEIKADVVAIKDYINQVIPDG